MNRRNFLIAVGAATAISGCAGNGEGTTSEDTATPKSTAEETPEATREPTPEPTESETATETEEEPEPANLVLTNLSIEPSEPEAGSEVTVTAVVENTGGESGSRNVALQINGEEQDTEEIQLGADEQKTIEFVFVADKPGRYDVGVGGLQDGFNVPSEPNLTIQDQSLSAADTPFHNAYAEAIIENVGHAPSGTIELTARWFDDSGSFIGEESTLLPTLDAGETWVARVGTSMETDEIGDFELTGEYDLTPGKSPDGLSVANSSLNIEDEYSGTITTEVENTRQESLFMASFHGIVYDEEGDVIGGRETLESDISPGEYLFFEVSLSSTRTVHRISKADDHTVIVTESESTETRQFGE